MKVLSEVLLLSLTLFISGCNYSNGQITHPQKTSIDQPSNTNELRSKVKNTEVQPYDLRNSIGQLKTTDDAVKAGKVDIYQKDGSFWYSYKFIEDNGEKPEKNEYFKPFRYSGDGYIVFNLVGESKDFYEVVSNEETGDKKFVKKNSPLFERQKWEKYILDCYAIEFDSDSNPLHSSPKGGNVVELSSAPTLFFPVEISGDWLKVKWNDGGDKSKDENRGWVKWRGNGQMIIRLFETS